MRLQNPDEQGTQDTDVCIAAVYFLLLRPCCSTFHGDLQKLEFRAHLAVTADNNSSLAVLVNRRTQPWNTWKIFRILNGNSQWR